jgi:FMN-dependent NADH-azoreductase
MKTLLNVRASLFGADGQSSQLADRFVQDWLTNNPTGRVVIRDLAAVPVPHLTAQGFQALLGKAEHLTPEQGVSVELSDALIEELKSAHVIVFSVPMYNFSVPSTVRAYFDHIARAGVTFRYTAEGPEGLINGKSVYVFITRGGFYADHADTQTPYLRQFLSFIGLRNAQFVYAEGLAIDEATREKSLGAARQAVAGLVREAKAA